MRSLTLRIAVALVGWLALAAYDTRVETAIPWQSIYQAGTTASIPEHTTIADDTFDYLDPSGQLRALFGREGSAELTLVDINASFYRADLLYGVEPYGDEVTTEAEERTIPAPGLFAGLPDYSFAIYDWLNKNRTCPAFNQAEYASRCHEFIGWLGALNSVHFGSQATEMYAHLHGNALALAERARTMREAMTPAEREEYAAEIEEAELLALAYEGYAQHFIQDRWAMGHMWERWNSPDTAQVEASLPAHIAIGGLAGIIHGAEALVGTTPGLDLLLMEADPMSSPLPGPGSTARPMEYRHVRSDGTMSEPLPGTGDERYADMVAGTFSLSRYDPSRANQRLLIPTQMQSLRECAGAGWAEVIRALGLGESGGYGSFNAPLGSDAPGFDVVAREDCWNNWATNESIMIGLLGPNPGRSVALLGALDIAVPVDVVVTSSDTTPVVGARTELVAYATRLWLYGRDDPDGVDVSTGQMTSAAQSLGSLIGWGREFDPNTLWSFSHGGNFSLPEYAVPAGLDTQARGGPVAALAEEDLRGRDIQTLYGVFSGAQSDYWCENRDILDELRADPSLRNRELCELLAQRIFQGIDPEYQGVQSYEREADGAPVRSLCRIRQTSGVEHDSADDPGNPYWLDQGYVPAPDHTQLMTPRNTRYAAITNWCARTPVLSLLSDPELRDGNVAERIGANEDRMVLIGEDFGTVPGEVSLTDPRTGAVHDLTTHAQWGSNRIDVDVAHLELEDGQDYRIGLTLAREAEDAGPIAMPGLYYLRIQEPPELDIASLDLGGAGPCMDEVPDFQIVDAGAFLEQQVSAADVTVLAEQFANDAEPIIGYLRRQAACMRDLRAAGLPVIERAQEDVVSFIIAREGPFAGELAVFPITVLATLDADPSREQEDYYSLYINSVEGLAWYLERISNILFAWDRAANAERPMQRNGLEVFDWMLVAETPDAAYSAGFAPGQALPTLPPGVPGAVEMDQLRDSQLSMNMGFDLQYAVDSLPEEVQATLEGLPVWTQVQHSLVHHALPYLDEAVDALAGQVDAALSRRLAEYTPDGCTQPGEGACRSYIRGDEVDDETYAIAATYIDSLLGSNFFIDPYLIPALGMVGHGYPDGQRRTFVTWPDAERAEAALDGISGARRTMAERR